MCGNTPWIASAATKTRNKPTKPAPVGEYWNRRRPPTAIPLFHSLAAYCRTIRAFLEKFLLLEGVEASPEGCQTGRRCVGRLRGPQLPPTHRHLKRCRHAPQAPDILRGESQLGHTVWSSCGSIVSHPIPCAARTTHRAWPHGHRFGPARPVRCAMISCRADVPC